MTEVSNEQLMLAIESQHGGKARLHGVVSVFENFNGQPVWQGEVHVYDLDGHPRATRAYAWSSPVERLSTKRFYAVLHLGPIRSARDAVKAAIMAEDGIGK